MPTTITLKNLGAFAGATNLQLFLRKTSDNTLLAAGGDTGVDADSIGSFAWSIDEAIPAEQLLARIYEGATETAANIVIDSMLNVGFTEIGQEAAVLDSATQTQITGIKTKTDQLVFTIPNQLDTSIHSVTPSGFSDIFETYQIVESYAEVGVAPTPAEAMYMHQAFTDFSISGTGISVYGLDGATVVATWQMNSVSSPTSRRRVT